jgi:hypothetical protein
VIAVIGENDGLGISRKFQRRLSEYWRVEVGPEETEKQADAYTQPGRERPEHHLTGALLSYLKFRPVFWKVGNILCAGDLSSAL